MKNELILRIMNCSCGAFDSAGGRGNPPLREDYSVGAERSFTFVQDDIQKYTTATMGNEELYHFKQHEDERNCEAGCHMGDECHACGYRCVLAVCAWDHYGI